VLLQQEVWPPGLADTVCPRPRLMTLVHHFVSRIKKMQRWDVQTMWACDLDLWPVADAGRRLPSVYQVWSSLSLPFGRYGARCLSAWAWWPWPLTFLLEIGMRVASKGGGNLPSKFEHARPLGSRIIRYVRDRWTDGRTKATLIAPSSGGITTLLCV